MPEGDTVWLAGRTLDAALSGRVVDADFRVPQLAERGMRAAVLETATRGKHLLTRFDTGDTLHTHFKMEGVWHLYRPGEKWRRPAHQARVVLTAPARVAVGFSLGITELVRTDAEQDVVGHLGPDLLGEQWDAAAAAEAVARLAAHPERPVGEALLDQRNLAGVGNMYMAELCFMVGAHPTAPVRDVPDLPRLVDLSHRVLFANRDRVDQATTGDLRRNKQLWVYRRDKQTCRRCGTRIRVAQHGEPGRERAAYWCPSCQPEKRPSQDPASLRAGS